MNAPKTSRQTRIYLLTAIASLIALVLLAQVLASAGACSDGVSCIWKVSKHPLWIALVAWFLASAFQTHSRRGEARFQLFDRCSTVQGRLIKAASEAHEAKTFLRAWDNPNVQVRNPRAKYQADEEKAEANLDVAFIDAASLRVLIPFVFVQPAERTWARMLQAYTDFSREPDLRLARDLLHQASDQWDAFVTAAAPQVSQDFALSTDDPSRLAELKAGINRILDRIDPPRAE